MVPSLLTEEMTKFQMLNFPRFKIFKQINYWDLFARIAIIQCHRLGGSNNRNVLCLHSRGYVSELRCWQGWCLLEAVREGPVSGFSPWLVDGRLHAHMLFSLYVSVSKFSLLKRTLIILDQGPTLFQYNLTLTNYIYNDPISK